ncbi:quorum-sensing transcriptional regulator [Yersinia frederiksenii]|nr:LuxR family transcriptional regulator [Yersinia alsatica]CFQ40852.1 quorum-sensing transcriptional regulator [Yersinia frederiksenii]CNH93425.1 quorum-sensing transcriptional regulator [Yersinia frederiksenii]
MHSGFKKNAEIIETLRDYIDRKLIAYGNPKYTYMVINKKNSADIFIITSYPNEWAELYTTNSFQHIDPIVLTALKRFSPFSWDENITILSDLKSSKIFTLSKQYNIVNGYTYVLHDTMNNMAMLSLIMDDSVQQGREDSVSKDRGKLQISLIEIHEKMLMLSQNKGNNPERKGVEIPSKAILTPRENEVLHWASMGKTYQEIALITDITPRTVKYHIGNVVKKLGVINAKQAIRLGVELELIKPVLIR